MNTDEIIGIGLGGASAIGQTMFGISQAQQNQQQQVKDQRELMELSSNLSYQNWIRTNYSAQIEQMKKAGLSVGMMYKNGGSGGTLGGASGGSASKADTIPMDISNAISQNRAIESQIQVNEAQADKLKAEADKTRGVDTELGKTQVESLSQGIKNQKAQEKLTEMETNLKGVEYDLKEATLNDSIGIVRNELNAGLKQIYILENQGIITNEEARISRQKWGLELTGMNLNNLLTKSKTNLTDEQTKATTQGIINDMRNVITNIRNANTNERNMLINEWKTTLEKELKTRGLDQEETKIFMNGIEMIFSNL